MILAPTGAFLLEVFEEQTFYNYRDNIWAFYQKKIYIKYDYL